MTAVLPSSLPMVAPFTIDHFFMACLRYVSRRPAACGQALDEDPMTTRGSEPGASREDRFGVACNRGSAQIIALNRDMDRAQVDGCPAGWAPGRRQSAVFRAASRDIYFSASQACSHVTMRSRRRRITSRCAGSDVGLSESDASRAKFTVSPGSAARS